MRERAAQDGAVEHAGQLDVVDVVALAAEEPDVLLAVHATEADRVAGGAQGDGAIPQGRSLDGGHAVTSLVAGWSAAQCTAATMFL